MTFDAKSALKLGARLFGGALALGLALFLFSSVAFGHSYTQQSAATAASRPHTVVVHADNRGRNNDRRNDDRRNDRRFNNGGCFQGCWYNGGWYRYYNNCWYRYYNNCWYRWYDNCWWQWSNGCWHQYYGGFGCNSGCGGYGGGFPYGYSNSSYNVNYTNYTNFNASYNNNSIFGGY